MSGASKTASGGDAAAAATSAIWREYWEALSAAEVAEQSDVNGSDAKPYKYETLTVAAANPVLGLKPNSAEAPSTRFVVRDFFPKIWEAIQPSIGGATGRFRLLVRGSSGTGKTSLALGYLLYQLKLAMALNEKLERVVYTLSGPRGHNFSATVFHRDGDVEHLEAAASNASVCAVCTAPSTVWLMDGVECGPSVESVQGVCVQLTAPNPVNYIQMSRHRDASLSLPAWDSGGRAFSELGVPLELHALARCKAASSGAGAEIADAAFKEHYRLMGPLPQYLLLAEDAFACAVHDAQLEMDSMTAHEAKHSMTSPEVLRSGVGLNVKYAKVDRNTLQPTGAALVPCALSKLVGGKRGVASITNVEVIGGGAPAKKKKKRRPRKEFYCKCCDYVTCDNANFHKHKRSKKHKRRSEEAEGKSSSSAKGSSSSTVAATAVRAVATGPVATIAKPRKGGAKPKGGK